MRIVYDDTKQSELVEVVKLFMKQLDVKTILAYEWGTERVQMHRLRERLDLFLDAHRMSIGNTVTHAHGIGNNCQYPVYYRPDDAAEIQQCAFINLNTGLYGEGYVSCEDYNGNRISPAYEVRKTGVLRTA